jgi:hypothetical protein
MTCTTGFDSALRVAMKTIPAIGIVVLIVVDCRFLGSVAMEGSIV